MVDSMAIKKYPVKLVRPLLSMGGREEIYSVQGVNTVWQEDVAV
jgi:hypothetical protein